MKQVKCRRTLSLFLCGMMLLWTTTVSLGNQSGVHEVTTLTRTIAISNTIESDKILSEFDEASLTEDGSIITFYAKKTITAALLSDIDEISLEADFEENFEYYITEYFEETPPTVTYLLNADMESLTFDLTYTLEVDNEQIEDDIFGFLIENENGQMDGMACLEDECVLLSEICATGDMIDNIGWLSKLWNKMRTSTTKVAKGITKIFSQPLKVVVQVIVTPVVEVLGGCLEVKTRAISVFQSVNNYSHNMAQDDIIVNEDGYIDDQNDEIYKDYKFGFGTIYNNGCGIIATYNVLRFVGLIKNEPSTEEEDIEAYRRTNLANLIRKYELSGGALVNGLMGIGPTAISRMLYAYKSKSYEYVSYASLFADVGFANACNNLGDNQIAILCYWYIEGGSVAAHYVAFTKADGKYTVYNDQELRDYLDSNDTIYEYLNNEEKQKGFIQGWVVTKCEEA